MPAPRGHRSAALPVALLLTAALALAGCGGDDDGDGAPDPQATAGGGVLDSTWPLTGLEVTGEQSAAQEHPVMVLKMDNTASSAPQQGLGTADLVVEELVEGGMTRLAAFFYSKIPGDVGPVRSMRATDIGIVRPTGGVMVTSGAAQVTIDRIRKAGIAFFQEGDKGFFRDDSRSAPYNLFANLRQTATLVEDDAARPDDYLPWGTTEDLPQGQPAKRLSARFSGGHATDWIFDGKKYVNQNSYAADGDEFPADTVLVLRVQVGDAGYTDPAGNPVPESKLDGKGPALLFHDGRLVRGTWRKDGLDGHIQLATKAGDLTVPAGRTWIELVPANGGDVTFGR
ncbi:DUF3048 domain-containing protein [Nocardioides sp. SYSU D00038]|uniref:DUF3048 domain-containing protein n=1 Tax=Nocardioides sp. SYSU D00038 TaxID=2812554 RepID=UPI00196895A9|nr:DUF3048 domain-containing protein [Nocardioides sp. SYSU D00038]